MIEEICEDNDCVDGNMISRRQLRARSKNRLFSDDTWLVSNDEDDYPNAKAYYVSYNLSDKLKNSKFMDLGFVKNANTCCLSTEYFDQHGFNWPILVQNKQSLGLSVPPSSFSVNDVRKCVGSDRVVDVMDVSSQKNIQMTMKDYQRYYESAEKEKLYNVISLEFSHTKLEELVVQPMIVRKIDWVELFWPKALKKKQMDATNALMNMMYPKVQKYCLMSVKGCYTDFHVDLGGTSVWYHILKGMKVFWLIRPTEENLKLYKRWVLTDKQLDNASSTFLGDIVDECERVVLKAGQTFFIPSGWIHAVYTPKDSIVFGGNFLHSYSVDMQLTIWRVENELRVKKKFQYPFFAEMHWFVLYGYTRMLSGKCGLRHVNEYDKQLDCCPSVLRLSDNVKMHYLLCVKSIVRYLYDLPDPCKCLPDWFRSPKLLLTDIIGMFDDYKNLLESNNAIDPAFDGMLVKFQSLFDSQDVVVNLGFESTYQKKRPFCGVNTKSKIIKKYKSVFIAQNAIRRAQNGFRRRRTRCRTCVACLKEDCGDCVYCKDMIKYGGLGRAKQSCVLRQCLQPVLPNNSVCLVCKVGVAEDAHLRNSAADVSSLLAALQFNENVLMECSICYEIVHPKCIFDKLPARPEYDVVSNLNNDLPNSWKCLKCHMKHSEKAVFNRQRFFKARSKLANASDLIGRKRGEIGSNLLCSSEYQIKDKK